MIHDNTFFYICYMNYIVFDDSREDLLPLTYIRPVADLRIGILTIREKWSHYLNSTISPPKVGFLQPVVLGNDNGNFKNVLIDKKANAWDSTKSPLTP